ncbi:MAG TPA: AAA family ATPase, partial [Candidatus Omnitrophica bacterium]|nr:AAA family ATPase [Candidatus Omnitrophota bacterium]
MLHEQTITILNQLKLFGMARSFAERIMDAKHAELDHAEFVGLLAQDEKTHRESQRLKRLLKNAKLRMQACLEDVDYRHPRGLEKAVVRELASARWIEARRNILITGPTGIGKSYLGNALGNQAARTGHTTLYIRAPRLFESLHQAQGDGTHLRVLDRLAKAQVLIIDDFLLTPLSETERKDMLEIVEDRYQAGPTVVTSQCPLKQWHEGIGDPTLADAILDRL